MRTARRVAVLITVASALSVVGSGRAAATPVARNDLAAQTALAERYAPVVELVDSGGACDGEPYEPLDVDAVLGNPDVALRGPWSGQNLVKVGPSAADLTGLPNYNLDFPGDALRPGCRYARWSSEIAKDRRPTVYAHVVAQEDVPGRLALQYWFFYAFNDFNDKHEGDWEMIQLDFRAQTAGRALEVGPHEVGFSQHTGAERAEWGSSKLAVVDDTHPVVRPALGSHANYYSPGVFLGRSAAEGVGCDVTTAPTRSVRPAVAVVPQARADYLKAFPWLGFEGRWGEKHAAFDNGPTGPNTKGSWTEPFTKAKSWRNDAFAVPAGGALGHGATSFFCDAVGTSSALFNRILDNPQLVLISALLLFAFLAWLASRTSWGPAVTFRLRRRRSWGTLVASAVHLYASNVRLYLGLGLVFVPLGLLAAGLQWLLFDIGVFEPLVHVAGRTNPAVVASVEAVGFIVTLFGLTIVQAATAFAMIEQDDEREVTAVRALRHVVARWRPLLLALLTAAVVIAVLGLTGYGSIIGAYLVVRWSLIAQAVVIGDGTDAGPLRQSWRATRGSFWRTASVILFVSVLCLLIGPLVGALLLLATPASFSLVNLVAAVFDGLLSPLIAITTTYLYSDLRVRTELAGARPAGRRPAEI